MHAISYADYLDKVLGGWLGKCIGGTIGDRFEGTKDWIDLPADAMFPPVVPPNDDLDLQVLWLKVIEEKGLALTALDLAEAWRDWCWYPFNEYAVFLRNIRFGIQPPASGSFGNQFWETGMGCAIRAEIWGYSFPGRPELAVHYAAIDGVLDHTEDAVGAEKMLAAICADAFFENDVRVLIDRYSHYLPAGSAVAKGVAAAISAFDDGLTLREARDRALWLGGAPEACDIRANMPIIVLGLLYGGGDLERTLMATLNCGYDADSTMATTGALIGQILGASKLPKVLTDRIGDELVLDIAYHRPEMTISALARDTARLGALFSADSNGAVRIIDAPDMAPLPSEPVAPRLHVRYHGLPSAAPGDTVRVTLAPHGISPDGGIVTIDPPSGWTAEPIAGVDGFTFDLKAPAEVELWADCHRFRAHFVRAGVMVDEEFGIAGAAIWRLLGLFHDAAPAGGFTKDPCQPMRRFNHHYVDAAKAYLPEPPADLDALHHDMSRRLGRPAVLLAHENAIELEQLIGLEGPLVAYCARTIVSGTARPAFLSIGNTDAFAVFLNGERIGGCDEISDWAPFNHNFRIDLVAGDNEFVVKLVKRSDAVRLTFALREFGITRGEKRNMNSPNHQEIMRDLADRVPHDQVADARSAK